MTPPSTAPIEALRALLTAVARGDEDLAHRLAHEDPHAACLALEATRWIVAAFADLTGLDGPELATWWAQTLTIEAAGLPPETGL